MTDSSTSDRPLPIAHFDALYDRFIVGGDFVEKPAYYPRYRSRYREILRIYASLSSASPQQVLDVGGGQLALLSKLLWGDDPTVSDVGPDHFHYLNEHGVRTVQWNLCSEAQPFHQEFDCVFFSEVIEHLPVPGHLVLERLKNALKPNGVLICTTPNLYRPRNVIYLASGIRIFDYFREPTSHGLGHVLEYSRDHLEWQLNRSGFTKVQVTLRQFHHFPGNFFFGVLAFLGYPLFIVPRFRDNLVAVAYAPANSRS